LCDNALTYILKRDIITKNIYSKKSKNIIMNEKIRVAMIEIIHDLSLPYHCKNDDVPQISSYHGGVLLTEFVDSGFTIGTQQSHNHGHILIMNKTIEEIKKDYYGAKKISPVFFFTLKQGEKWALRLSGHLNEIDIGAMNQQMFEVYIQLHKLVKKLK